MWAGIRASSVVPYRNPGPTQHDAIVEQLHDLGKRLSASTQLELVGKRASDPKGPNVVLGVISRVRSPQPQLRFEGQINVEGTASHGYILDEGGERLLCSTISPTLPTGPGVTSVVTITVWPESN